MNLMRYTQENWLRYMYSLSHAKYKDISQVLVQPVSQKEFALLIVTLYSLSIYPSVHNQLCELFSIDGRMLLRRRSASKCRSLKKYFFSEMYNGTPSPVPFRGKKAPGRATLLLCNLFQAIKIS